jgi:hypothetical protein
MLKMLTRNKKNSALEKNLHVVQQLFTDIQKIFILLQKCSISEQGSPSFLENHAFQEIYVCCELYMCIEK